MTTRPEDIVAVVDAVLGLAEVRRLDLNDSVDRAALRLLFVTEAQDPTCFRCRLPQSACRRRGCPMPEGK